MSLPFEIPPIPDESAKQSSFTPTFGAIPPLLADRQNLIHDFAYALDNGPGARGRATLVTGTRGVGKSLMLRVFCEVADSRQWLTVSAQARPGFVDRLTTARLPETLLKMDTVNTRQTRVKGGSFSILGFGGSVNTETENTAPVTPDFQHQLMRTLEILDKHGTGLLLILGEVHRSQLGELQEVTDALSTAVADGAPFAFAAAGLPETINGLVNEDVSTFLRRAERVNFGNLSAERAAAIAETTTLGREITGSSRSSSSAGEADAQAVESMTHARKNHVPGATPSAGPSASAHPRRRQLDHHSNASNAQPIKALNDRSTIMISPRTLHTLEVEAAQLPVGDWTAHRDLAQESVEASELVRKAARGSRPVLRPLVLRPRPTGASSESAY